MMTAPVVADSSGNVLDVLSAFLASVRKTAGADAVQLIGYGSETRILVDCAPSAEISRNLANTAGNLPVIAKGSRTVVNTYRFGGRLVHLAASDCGDGRWLLIWFRIPEGASPENIAGIADLAALALPRERPVPEPSRPSFNVLDALEPSASRSRQQKLLCQWLAGVSGGGEVFLARKTVMGWRVSAASGQLPSPTSPLAHAIVHALRGRSGDSALEEIHRLTAQPSSRIVELGPRHAFILAGAEPGLPPEIVKMAARLLPLLDPPLPTQGFTDSLKTSSARRRLLMLAGLILIVGILAFPVHQRVHSDVILEPSVRRFIAAPFNGVLKKVHARAGDIVEPGQLLVELDGREITEQLADVEARLSSAILQNTTELESSNYSQAAVRSLDAESLVHERDLLRHKQKNLKLYSPVRGVIVTGELERSEGATVELGKPLLELAPLDVMLAEIAVDEKDVSIVKDKMEVAIKLNALPDRTLRSDVFKVSPRSETRDAHNVFVTEAELPNPDGLLRPGMKGQAIIYSTRRPLAWTLVRKPWQVVQRWLFR